MTTRPSASDDTRQKLCRARVIARFWKHRVLVFTEQLQTPERDRLLSLAQAQYDGWEKQIKSYEEALK